MSTVETETLTIPDREEDRPEQSASESADNRSDRPFGGLTPAEAAKRRAEKQREKRATREAEAELDKLTVQARAAVVASRVLTVAEQEAILRAHVREAAKGKVQSARFVLDWLKIVHASGPSSSEGDDKAWEDMTPAERAVWKDRVDAELRALDVSQSTDGAAS